VFEETLKAYIKEKFGSLTNFASEAGLPTSTVYNGFKRGFGSLASDTVAHIADMLEIDAGALIHGSILPLENIRPYASGEMIPVVSFIKCGWNGACEGEFLGEEYADVSDPDRYVWMIAEGDSMEPLFDQGDRLLIRKQNWADNGDYVAAVLSGEEGTLKMYSKNKDGILLSPLNKKYAHHFIPAESADIVYIYGVVVEVKKSIKPH